MVSKLIDDIRNIYPNDNFVTEEDIAQIEKLGFNCVRVPFWYRNFMTEDLKWLAENHDDNKGLQKLDWLISICEKYIDGLAEEPAEFKYSDIKGHWAEEMINKLAEIQIGFKGEKFNPDEPISQYDLLKLFGAGIRYKSYLTTRYNFINTVTENGREQRRSAALKFVFKSFVSIVGVCIKNAAHQRTRSPRGVAGSRKITLTSSSPEARSIPSDSTPQSFAGARLATTMTFLPTISSGEIFFSPEKMRG